MYFVGCTSIYLMVAISFERLYVIGQPIKRGRKKIAKSYYFLVIILCIVLGLFWSLLPISGWSYYSFEGFGTSCSVEWNDKTLNVVSYNFTILVFVFLIPSICLLVNNLKLICMVSLLKKILF